MCCDYSLREWSQFILEEHMQYEYECTVCKNFWEEEQSIKDDPIKVCPECKNESAKRLISKSNFILAGGCWASDGYRK